MAKPEELLTITQLARRTGIASRTIRFWSDTELIPVARRSHAHYRLYDVKAVSRLELVHTLRALGMGLQAITEILKRDKTVAQAARTHLAAIDAQLDALKLQRAVLQVVVRRAANAKEIQLMHKLIQTSSEERRRIVDAFLARAFAGIDDSAPGAAIPNAMRSLPPQLPEAADDAQLEAWLELAALLADAAFAQRVREMALAGAAEQLPQPVDIAAIREHAGAALAAGLAPESKEAAAIVEHILAQSSPLTATERVQLRQRLETYNDVRVERYWQLMAILNGRAAFPPIAAACAWFIEALAASQ